jgi:hypothetical protein
MERKIQLSRETWEVVVVVLAFLFACFAFALSFESSRARHSLVSIILN